MVYITRKFSFSASHRIYRQELSDQENFKVYGKCSNPTGHGHNYELEVTLSGNSNEETGYLMDLTILKEMVNEKIIEKVDHKNINTDVDFMKDVIPTTENIASRIFTLLKKELKLEKGIKLYSVKLMETNNNMVEYRESNE